MKTCSYCKETLPENMFWNTKKNKDGLHGQCKTCKGNKIKERLNDPIIKQKHQTTCKKWRSQNKERMNFLAKRRYYKNPEKAREDNRQRRSRNPEPSRIICRQWYIQNKEKVLAYKKEYQQTHRKEIRKRENNWRQSRIQNDPTFHIQEALRGRIRKVLHGISKSRSTINLIGCSPQKLKEHIEKQFQPGMTWENYGFYGWHVHHIRPCFEFDLTKPEEQTKCFHYSNLCPMYADKHLNFKHKGVGRRRATSIT